MWLFVQNKCVLLVLAFKTHTLHSYLNLKGLHCVWMLSSLAIRQRCYITVLAAVALLLESEYMIFFFSYVQSKDSQNGNVFSSFCSHFAVLPRHAAHIVTDGEFDGQTFRFSTNVISFQKCSVICLVQPVYPDKLLICAFAAPHLPHKNIFSI